MRMTMKTSKSILTAMLLTAALAGCQQPVKTDQSESVQAVEEIPMAMLVDTPTITAPPAELKLDPFYKKYMNVNGIHVVSSWRVPDSCFYAAYISIKAMTDALPAEVMKSLTDRNTRIGIMARYEGTTDIPEHAFLRKRTPKKAKNSEIEHLF